MGRCPGEDVGLFQDRWHAQHEAEEQAGHEGTQGHQPLHQGAVRVQGEACFEDSSLPSNEEAQDDALNRARAHWTWTYELRPCSRHSRCLVDSSRGGWPRRALLYILYAASHLVDEE